MTSHELRPLGSKEGRRVRVVRGMLGAFALVGFVFGVFASLGFLPRIDSLSSYLFIMGPVVLLFVIVTFAASIWYWRTIDELARQAHLDAWFWGGTAGMIAGCFAMGALAYLPEAWSCWALCGTPSSILLTGALILGVSGLAGYAVAWIWFWLRQR